MRIAKLRLVGGLTIVGLLISLATSACAAPSATAATTGSDCRVSAADEAWIGRALDAWTRIRAARLKLAPARPEPMRIFYDAHCRYETSDGRTWRRTSHDGQVVLPDGHSLPARVASFAAPYDGGRSVFFVMGLPSIWQAGGVKSELGLETLMKAVFVHEFSHTQQFAAYNPRIDAASRRWGLGDDLDDDVVQTRFAKDPAYVAAFDAERERLFQAAAAPTDAAARTLARQGLEMMRARRARWFTGADAMYADLDDIFLTMEGIAQWAGYAWLVDPKGGGLSPAAALPGMRRGGRQWSQDEGLAILLVVDRLSPGWPTRAFAPEPAMALGLLSAAVR